jgi:sugar phosphate isomerase/epimerase
MASLADIGRNFLSTAMPNLSRRNFIQAGAALGAATVLTPNQLLAQPAKPALRVFATNWGFAGNYDAFCAKAKDTGYDGIEVWAPNDDRGRDELMAAVQKHQLLYAFLAGAGDPDPAKHAARFGEYLRRAAAMKPQFINCHTGKDYFTFEQNKALIDIGLAVEKETGIRVLHETHRGRFTFAAHVTRQYLEAIPGLRLTLDISHWCNVHESLLDDQAETVQLALSRTAHLHTRVGHPEGPQVGDPRAPEWQRALDQHLGWWDKVVELQQKAGASVVTLTPEFGPVSYMPALPYTQQPVANQWDINAHMMKLLRQRYA